MCLFTSCLEEECEQTTTYQSYIPIIVEAADWRSTDFASVPTTEVCEPSGFYVYGDYFFVLDRNEGLQILDNRDNAHPRPVKQLSIPGAQAISVRNDVLYINQYIDLLAFDLSDPTEPKFLSRSERIFQGSSTYGYGFTLDDDLITGYTEGTEVREEGCNSLYYGDTWFCYGDVFYTRQDVAFSADVANFAFAQSAGSQRSSTSTPLPETVGSGGSLATFTITQGNLYVVDYNNLRAFSLADPEKPALVSDIYVGWEIETIFPYEDKLFIGAQSGLHIYSLADPLAPAALSTFEHIRSCDPVVVQNDKAYVTLWGGSECGNQGDQLMVVDVADATQPTLIQELPMTNSHGLGIAGNKLFLCSGEEGVRVFDVLESGLVGDEVDHLEGFAAKDVIVRGDRNELIVFGWQTNGIQQYDYSDEGKLTQVSSLSVCQ